MLSLKTDVNLPPVRNKQKSLECHGSETLDHSDILNLISLINCQVIKATTHFELIFDSLQRRSTNTEQNGLETRLTKIK
jgi:hypothetical protein